ncbi:phosphoadenosine phosphosulfate reductase [Actinacidiphila acididurans]|uniref:Phosphoadenosine phosphosulfate reductase n=1 Tax=Actinacidiphila acididurans TaxID=2784346 RepID=A0ABS2TPP8_9ACTN|nr:phosphoadenosine phosphosulfate reductase [Actinacidiphila acididurans]MBM9505047.1 phosphoadenosine phosphosulfate reductase [Actinacidiphila acididurans]
MDHPTTTTTAPAEPLKSFSFGGGWQSMAALVLAARGELDYRTFVMANVGDDSENPATLTYLNRYAIPYAQAHGLELVVVDRVMKRTKETRTLLQDLTRPGGMSVKIPVRMSNGAPGTRSCTAQFKIKVVGDELRRRGATADHPATVGIGITLDEIARANPSKHEPYERLEYPLLERGIRRADCPRIIRTAGLPIPPKSSCWFCPLRRAESWQEMRRAEPELFERACALEDELNRRRDAHGKKDHVYLTRYGKPLRQAIAEGVDALFDLEDLDDVDNGCDSGWCWT